MSFNFSIFTNNEFTNLSVDLHSTEHISLGVMQGIENRLDQTHEDDNL